MTVLLWIAAVAAGLLHVLFFCEESLWWMRPSIHQGTFKVTLEQAQVIRLFAFNQGFYNLFLAVQVFLGLALLALGHATAGRTLVAFACASMVGAALVLVASQRSFWVGAVVQGTPAALALAALATT